MQMYLAILLRPVNGEIHRFPATYVLADELEVAKFLMAMSGCYCFDVGRITDTIRLENFKFPESMMN